jgi:hypothetical protein
VAQRVERAVDLGRVHCQAEFLREPMRRPSTTVPAGEYERVVGSASQAETCR